ncbi:MAG: hypothetical protein Q8M92_01395, partial [Candidatus Subteraquimicrobiales bacterium]|nr:hypothetical protein [Candidatus Subteraquimicrobiales bacterium]
SSFPIFNAKLPACICHSVAEKLIYCHPFTIENGLRKEKTAATKNSSLHGGQVGLIIVETVNPGGTQVYDPPRNTNLDFPYGKITIDIVQAILPATGISLRGNCDCGEMVSHV